jgi:hypothetical protein
MNLAILFWFYKEPEICENRLQLLKKYNPDLKIYGLFGGEKNETDKYKQQLEKYLDDFYVSPYEDSDWKWINGDLMILEWFDKRGRELEWDSVAVVQWDMLVFDSIQKQFNGMKKNEIYLSGTRTLDKKTEDRWHWTRPDRKERKNYIIFLEYIEENYGHTNEILCCLFIFQIFPRIFFEKYLAVKDKEIGMLEYKIPMYAKIFGIPFFEKDLGAWRFETERARNETPLKACTTEIKKSFIESELKKENGFRIFHPYFKKWQG